ncbi:hypothetical protein Z948_2298 [Sulfitobacter donghicola DSW-25 = KCTC 12864 = JCM 14565]|nr:hypothetical protein Z948_2298 [Sulfitobacter donghicola DSW-25 = KCTC 12864 = JCM 14565]
MFVWAKPNKTKGEKWRRAAIFTLGFVALLAVIVTLMRLDVLTVPMLFSALVGFYLGIGVWLISHRVSSQKLVKFANSMLDREGEIHTVISSEQISIRSGVSDSNLSWDYFDEAFSMVDATVLRAGALVYTFPDAALPEGTSPQEFRKDLESWMGAKT